MSSTMDTIRSDAHKAPDQLEREADDARSAVEGTLSALEERLSPGQLLDRVMDVTKRHGGEFGENLLAQVRNNPVATIVAGVGVAWLMAASKRPPPRAASMSADRQGRWDGGQWRSTFESARDGASSTAESAWDSASSKAESAWDSASSTAESAWDAASQAMDSTAQAARNATETVSRTAQRATDATRHAAASLSESWSHLCREQPVALGAIALAIGAALGALLPSTEAEDEMLGATSDETKARLRREAQSRADRLRDAAGEAVESTRTAMSDQAAQSPE